MILIVGLGNPGPRYVHTRHNLGFLALDMLASLLDAPAFIDHKRFAARIAKQRCGRRHVLLAKPQTFMNDSGRSVAAILRYHRIPVDHLWVAHDDLDLPVGVLRLSFDSRAAGHNGVQSIIDAVGSKTFHRLRIGIGRAAHGDQTAYVLQRLGDTERETMTATLESGLRAFAEQELGCHP